MKIIQLDGDFYQIRLPNADEWMAYSEKYLEDRSCKNIPIQLDYEDKALILPHQEVETCIELYGEPRADAPCICYRKRDGGIYRGIFFMKRQISFRPVLVPLDKNLSPISDLFQRDNPNGTIIRGGTWEKQWIHDSKQTEKNMIPWLMLDGKLFCHTPSMRISPEAFLSWDIEFFF